MRFFGPAFFLPIFSRSSYTLVGALHIIDTVRALVRPTCSSLGAHSKTTFPAPLAVGGKHVTNFSEWSVGRSNRTSTSGACFSPDEDEGTNSKTEGADP